MQSSFLKNIENIYLQPFKKKCKFAKLKRLIFSLTLANKLFNMKKTTLLLYILVLCFEAYTQHNEGDTIKIRVHDKKDITWYGNYDVWGQFPSESITFRKITMHYTLGCASGGCSDWDYTTKIELLHPSGQLDTAGNPIKTPFELARVMTPYGGYMRTGQFGFTNDWSITHSFDITDFAPFLKDSVELRAFYDGWSSGFSVTLDFEFIVGTPPRNVINIQNLWRGNFSYENSQQFETQFLHAKKYKFSTEEKAASIKFIPSGHGFDNNVYCAEFCSRFYHLKINQQNIFSNNMWNDQCGFNPIYPQAGTWVYNRANWCPGLPSKIFIHDITPYINNTDSIEIDFDFEEYTWSGTQTPSYYIDAQIFTYKNPNFENDAEMIDIIAPSQKDAYARHNPICNQPIIVVRNSGSNPITNMNIEYGILGNTPSTFAWTGNLAFLESDTIKLPTFEWNNTQNQIFKANIASTNLQTDQNPTNNTLQSKIGNIDIINQEKIVIELRTNAAGEENSWKITDYDGNIIASRNNLSNNETYRDTVSLNNNQCYTFELTDTGGDGLSFFGNNHGNGYIRIRKAESVGFIKIFNANFGNKIVYPFHVNTSLSIKEKNIPQDFHIYPNPAKNRIIIETEMFVPDTIIVRDMAGKIVTNTFEILGESTFRVDLTGLSKGIYIATLYARNNVITKKFMIE